MRVSTKTEIYLSTISRKHTLSAYDISGFFQIRQTHEFRLHHESCSASVYFVLSPSRKPSQARPGMAVVTFLFIYRITGGHTPPPPSLAERTRGGTRRVYSFMEQ
jgi:hypothetical protein